MGGKMIKKLALFTFMIMLVLSMVTIGGTEEVKAGDYDYLNVKNWFDWVDIKADSNKTFSKRTLDDGNTNVYCISIEEAGYYYVGFTDKSYGAGSIMIETSDYSIFEKKVNPKFTKWEKKIRFEKGNYFINVLSREDIGFDYELFIKSAIPVKKKTVEIKITSCDKKTLEPKLGKGKWTTSNKDVVKITSSPNNSAVCKVWAKKAGKAVVTYTNSSGSVIKYKFTVVANSNYPFDRASCSMNTVGGLEPFFIISNNSNKTIKYVYLTISFYNAVGDKVANDIGGYTSRDLKLIGPIKPYKFSEYDFSRDPVFYSDVATKMKVENMTVEYMDGSKISKKINKKFAVE